jgi:xanthine dehydrogenase accessory factor
MARHAGQGVVGVSIFVRVAELEQSGEPAAYCVVVETGGSVPRHPGSKMIVYPDGRIEGTVGGGEVESRVIQEAVAAIAAGKPRNLRYNMVDQARGDPGICGGHLEVYIEPILPSPAVLVIGGGHVGKAVVHLAKWLGFRVLLSDDRPEFCSPEWAPDADAYYPVPMADLPQVAQLHNQTYVVLTTRGSGVDSVGLPALLASPVAYIGIIGSRKRWLTTRKALEDAGVPQAQIDRIHSPIGLELQAETPEEIAVSILAEIIMLRHGGSGQRMKE